MDTYQLSRGYRKEHYRIELLAKRKVESYDKLSEVLKKRPQDTAYKCKKCKEETGHWIAYQIIHELSNGKRILQEQKLVDFPTIGLPVSYCNRHLP